MSIGTVISAVPTASAAVPTAGVGAGTSSGGGTTLSPSASAVAQSDSSSSPSVSNARAGSTDHGGSASGAGNASSGSFGAALAGASASSSRRGAGHPTHSSSATASVKASVKSTIDPHAHHGKAEIASSAASVGDRAVPPQNATSADTHGAAPVSADHGKTTNKSGHHDPARTTVAGSPGQAPQAQAAQTSLPPSISGSSVQASAAAAVQALSSHQTTDVARQVGSHAAPVVPGLADHATAAAGANALSIPVADTAGPSGSATTVSSSQQAASSASTTSGVPHSAIDSLAREAISRLQSAAVTARPTTHTAAASAASSTSAHGNAETRISAISANSTVASEGQPAAPLAMPAAMVNVSSAAVPALTGAGSTNGAASGTSSNSVSGQIAAALVGVSQIQPPQGSASATPGTRLTIALAPPAIGTVTLQIDRHADGSSTVAIGASHTDTLQQLQNDRNTLDQVLTQAGLPATHRTVTFDLIAPRADVSGSQQAGIGAGANGFGGGFAFAGSGSNGGSSGSPGSGRLPVYVRSPVAAAGIASAAEAVSSLPAVTLHRFGVNVVA